MHQPVRNVTPSGEIYGKVGKTVGVDTLSPSQKDAKQLYEYPPVLSIHGTDVIYYGETLLDYFNIELGEKKQADIAFERIVPVPFWSEIM